MGYAGSGDQACHRARQCLRHRRDHVRLQVRLDANGHGGKKHARVCQGGDAGVERAEPCAFDREGDDTRTTLLFTLVAAFFHFTNKEG